MRQRSATESMREANVSPFIDQAWHLRRRMDDPVGLEVVGFALTLMLANLLQLVGIVFILAGLFGDR